MKAEKKQPKVANCTNLSSKGSVTFVCRVREVIINKPAAPEPEGRKP